MRESQDNKERQAADESKRRDLKRIAGLIGLALVAASFPLFAGGCESTKNGKKDSKTLDDFLGADKPSY